MVKLKDPFQQKSHKFDAKLQIKIPTNVVTMTQQ